MEVIIDLMEDGDDDDRQGVMLIVMGVPAGQPWFITKRYICCTPRICCSMNFAMFGQMELPTNNYEEDTGSTEHQFGLSL